MTPEGWRANVRRAYAWRALTMMHFFAGALIPFFTEWGGLTLDQVFYLQAWFILWIFLLEVPTGAVADRWGRKASLLCSNASLIAAVSIYASGKGLPRYLLAELVWAAAAAFSSGADEALVYDSLKAAGDEAGAKRGLTRLASFEIGAIAVAAQIGSQIAARWGLRAPMWCMIAPFSIGLLVGATLREPPTGEERARPGYAEVLTRGVRYFVSHSTLRALAFDSVTVWMLSFMAVWLFQARLAELGVGIGYYGFVTAGMTLAQIGLLAAPDRVERLFGGSRRYLRWSAVIPGLAFLALPFAHAPLAAAALFVAITGFGLSRAVIISNHINRHVDSARRATVLSAVGMARQCVGIVVFPAVGLLTRASLDWTFAALGVAVLGCAWVSGVEEAHLA